MGRARFLLYTGFINRAAMGRARFLLYTGFIIIFFLTARPWAERGSCFTRDLLLTARPWAERGSCSARDLLVVVVVVVFFLSVTRPKPPLGQIVIVSLNHATCDVYSPKAVETLMYGKCYGYCFLYCVYFLLVLSKRWTRS